MTMAPRIVGLIQAHHRSWGGALDFSLAVVDGKTAVAEVIDRLKAMPRVADVVVAVPDDPGNHVFRQIAADHGARCHFGSVENVLERCAGALGDGDIAIHVMGQHCFIDTGLLGGMLDFLEETGADYVSLPDDFTPYFAGKVYRRRVLDQAAAVIAAAPDRARNQARFAGFIENNRDTFNARIYRNLPRYDRDYLLRVRQKAVQIFSDDRLHVDPIAASKATNGLVESYEFALGQFGAADRVVDIACGDGYGCRILAQGVGQVIGLDINQPLIAANQDSNDVFNIAYDVGDCFALGLPDGAVTGATAMELIEHLPVDKVDQFVGEVRRVVAPGGRFICSTPQNSYGEIPVVPWHVREYSMAELRAILERHFETVTILSSKSGGRLSEDCDSGQKMVALCR